MKFIYGFLIVIVVEVALALIFLFGVSLNKAYAKDQNYYTGGIFIVPLADCTSVIGGSCVTAAIITDSNTENKYLLIRSGDGLAITPLLPKQEISKEKTK